MDLTKIRGSIVLYAGKCIQGDSLCFKDFTDKADTFFPLKIRDEVLYHRTIISSTLCKKSLIETRIKCRYSTDNLNSLIVPSFSSTKYSLDSGPNHKGYQETFWAYK